MLCLERKVGEKIIIGDAEIVINKVLGNHVFLGITAPPHIPVHRAEVASQIAVTGTGTCDHCHGTVTGRIGQEKTCRCGSIVTVTKPNRQLAKRSDFESDMISSQNSDRYRAMVAQIDRLADDNNELRRQVAELESKLRNREHVE